MSLHIQLLIPIFIVICLLCVLVFMYFKSIALYVNGGPLVRLVDKIKRASLHKYCL